MKGVLFKILTDWEVEVEEEDEVGDHKRSVVDEVVDVSEVDMRELGDPTAVGGLGAQGVVLVQLLLQTRYETKRKQ